LSSTVTRAAISPTRERFGKSSISSAEGWRIGPCRCCPGRGSKVRSGSGVQVVARGSGARASNGFGGAAGRAGCSTGQEPYSVAMAVIERLPEPETWTLRVFASDLSFTALERAQAGVYSADQIRGLREPYLSKYFHREQGNYVVNDDLRRRVVFDYHNLKHDNGLRALDVIFCRNVMIYFDVEEQRRLVARFSNCLVPGGYLFIGHAESLQGLSQQFAMVHRDKGIAYRFNG